MTAPVLSTERLTLTPIEAGDLDDLARLNAHPEVGGRLKHGVLDREKSRAQLEGYLACWRERGFGQFVARDCESAFVGLVGLRWGDVTDEADAPALRYAIMPEHRGKGYTEEAVPALLAFAASLGHPEVIGATKPGNLVSRRIMERLGFRLKRESEATVVYAMSLGSSA